MTPRGSWIQSRPRRHHTNEIMPDPTGLLVVRDVQSELSSIEFEHQFVGIVRPPKQGRVERVQMFDMALGLRGTRPVERSIVQ